MLLERSDSLHKGTLEVVADTHYLSGSLHLSGKCTLCCEELVKRKSWSDEAFALYLIVDTILVMLYCAIWIICFKKNSVFRALALSIIPSMLFLFSGIMSRSVLLIIASVLFAPSHIMISYKNVK